MIAPARIAALRILTAVSAGTSDLPTAIAAVRTRLSDERDRTLAADIATGVQRWRAKLDHLIAAYSRRALDRLDPEIVEILRLSAYELLHHTRVPAAAVVDDAVDLARKAGKRSASGFVNGVLRTLSRNRDRLPLPLRPQEPAEREAALDYLSVTLSHPRWLVARWYDRWGFQAAESWIAFNNVQAPLTLRLNRLRITRPDLLDRLADEHVDVHPGAFAPDAFIVDHGRPLAGPGLAKGWFVPQDEASQLIPLLAGPQPGARILDACASPGGKTVALAGTMGNAGMLVAGDVRAKRMELLRQTLAASGATRVALVQIDLLQPLPFLRPFDCVLVDAPCSGLGTIRRDPDIRWRRDEADLQRFAAAQQQMLLHAADLVAPRGRLIYATCSSEPEENELVARAFLRETASGFAPRSARGISPDLPDTVVDADGHLRTLPHVHRLEAFFGAVFERRG